ncbi:hypothetical protein [Aureimonas populi]|uniref:TNase-like domain-containing protein n=1 Tax=Aureimonas populi TaxID=1701758 RepID=A0ABW5CI00_9HYPH|nr:hypothetical protein [Aureimonas populi]
MKQSLKIGAGLAAVIGLGLLALPESPALLAGSARLEAPAPSAPPVEAPAPQDAEVPAGTQTAQAEAPAPTPGQLHLQRLREGAGRSVQPPEADAPAETQAPAPGGTSDSPPPEDLPLPREAAPSGPPQFRLFRAPGAADSGTLLLDEQPVSLSGVVPLPADALCRDGSACGAEAREALRAYLARQPVLCALPETLAAGASAPCLAGEEDVGEWVVANGWAEAQPGSRYEEAEARAREAGRGLWAAGGL